MSKLARRLVGTMKTWLPQGHELFSNQWSIVPLTQVRFAQQPFQIFPLSWTRFPYQGSAFRFPRRQFALCPLGSSLHAWPRPRGLSQCCDSGLFNQWGGNREGYTYTLDRRFSPSKNQFWPVFPGSLFIVNNRFLGYYFSYYYIFIFIFFPFFFFLS